MHNKCCYFQPSPLSIPELTPKERVWKLLCRSNHFRGEKVFIHWCISGWSIQQRILLIKADHPPTGMPHHAHRVSQVVLMVKNLPASEEDVRDMGSSLGQEDPLEEGMETHSSIFVWRIPWTEEPDRLQSIGSHRVGHNWSNLAHTHAPCTQSFQPVLVLFNHYEEIDKDHFTFEIFTKKNWEASTLSRSFVLKTCRWIGQ